MECSDKREFHLDFTFAFGSPDIDGSRMGRLAKLDLRVLLQTLVFQSRKSLHLLRLKFSN